MTSNCSLQPRLINQSLLFDEDHNKEQSTMTSLFLDNLIKKANAGDSDAMNRLGWLFQNGKGVDRDLVKAREWYEQAISKGNSKAMFNLGEE